MRIATPPEEDRATAVTCTEIGEDRTCSSVDMIADRQTDRQTDTLITVLRSPIGGGVKLVKIGRVFSVDMIADRQTDRHGHHNTYGDSDVISFHIYASWFSLPTCG